MVWVEERSIIEQREKLLPQRRVDYKQTHKGQADKKGVLREFMLATTITQMRKILFG
jgi:hypothetical protein